RVLVYITWPVRAWSIPDYHVAALRDRFPGVDFVHVRTPEDAAAAIVDADVVFAPFLTPAMVDSAPRLRWVHSPAAAVEGLLPLAALDARGITISNSRGVQAIAIAEH